MEVIYSTQAIEDIHYWRKSGNRNIQNKITQLIEDIKKTPCTGIGKPEALKHDLTGKWSRRITKEHRLIYEVDIATIKIYSLKGHY
jgi:toxin YoeB